MERIELKPGVTVSVEITTEGKSYLIISGSTDILQSVKDKDLKSLGKKNEVVYEGDYKGEKLGKVKMEKSEILSLESSLGSSCLTYWIISLNQFADNEPAKFNKYKCHRACIQNWNKMRLEQGKVFSHIHPSGPGYYMMKDIDKLDISKLRLK